MCIRDRVDVDVLSVPRDESILREPFAEGTEIDIAANGMDPVSYTHLTLPTSDLV